MSIIGDRIRELRRNSDMNQAELAKILDVKTSTISGYESGYRNPDIEKFKLLADFFNVSYDYLLGESDSLKRENIDIAKRTGLSDEAIATLTSLKEVSETPLDESDANYPIDFSDRRDLRHYLIIINHLIAKDNIEDFAIPILNYVDKVRRIQKRTEAIQAIDDLKEKFGATTLTEEAMSYIRQKEAKGESVSLEEIEELPKNELSRQLEMQALKDEAEFEVWRMGEKQRQFALRVAQAIIDQFEIFPHEDD